MRVKINVTEDCIKRGVPENPCLCPVARAARRAGFDRVAVYDFVMKHGRRDKNGYEVEICLPVKVQRFIRRFDNSEPVKPFSFYVNY